MRIRFSCQEGKDFFRNESVRIGEIIFDEVSPAEAGGYNIFFNAIVVQLKEIIRAIGVFAAAVIKRHLKRFQPFKPLEPFERFKHLF